MKQTIKLILMGLSLVCINTSCQTESNKEIIEIRYGSKFGMCEGYCHSEYVITKDSEKHITQTLGDTILHPTKRNTDDVSDSKWNTLIHSVDLSEFYTLETTIGCPDCTDGGASWIEIKTEDKNHKVNYEFGKTPEPLHQLMVELKN